MQTVEKNEKKEGHGVLTIALAGNPNSGKTTIFNAFTKLRQKVGNYPGVTVEKKTGRFVLARDRVVNILDLPGTYSLAVQSPDEKVARDVLLGRMDQTDRPDLVVCVVDAGNIERNLYLFSQIQDLDIPVVIALNMMDEVKRNGRTIDCDKLSQLLGVPIVPMSANQNVGIDDLKEVIAQGIEHDYHRKWFMSAFVEEEIDKITQWLVKEHYLDQSTAFSEALTLLSCGRREEHEISLSSDDILLDDELFKLIDHVRESLTENKIRWRSVAVEARYNWIKDLIRVCVKEQGEVSISMTHKIDAVLTHKVWGWAFFFGLMSFMFVLVFSVATYPMGWIDAGFSGLAVYAGSVLPPGDFKGLIIDGIIAGVGGVVIFLPQILILFFFIGLLQDTGYMARAAFIMDRVMTRVGLHGKSFIPLLSSFACAIPGIMSARTIESYKDRLVTVLVAPLMSCSARLPVYTIMIAVLTPNTSAIGKAGIMLSMYLIGMLGAGLMAWVFKKTLLKSQKPTFIMELPPYRLPSIKTVMLQMWERSQLFLKRAGTIILAMSIVLWALMAYPKNDSLDPGAALKQSYAGTIGTTLEPVLKPLGYDWRIGIGLVGSFAAREVFVSTMSIVFSLDEGDGVETLQDAFQQASWPDGRVLFTPLVCLSLMVFFVFAMQCLSTVAIVWREVGWRWATFQVVYMTILAYGSSFLVYQGGRLFGWE